MIAEVSIVCASALIGLGMVLFYLRSSNPPQKPLNQKELDEIREDIKKLETRFTKGSLQKVFQ